MPASPWWVIGWRNLGRNRRRTALTAAALAVGYFAVVVLVGLMKGLVTEMIGNGTGILTGQLQVHAADYRPDRSVYATIGGAGGVDVDALVAAIVADPAVAAATPRVYGGGLISAGAATVAAIFVGVDVEREPQVARLTQALTRGRALRPGVNELLVGTEMARTLGVDPGDELVVVAPAVDGSLGNDLFVVVGVFESDLADLDRTFALLPVGALQALIALPPSRVHEIAARVPEPWRAPEAAARVDTALAALRTGAVAEPWTTLRPELVEYAELSGAFSWILLVVVFAMAIFGVANTMLMATFERRREFAVLRALGTTPGGIVRSVLYEALVLGALSLAVGAALTVPVLVWWHNVPPDLSWLFGDFEMAGALVRPVLRVEYPRDMLVGTALALFATACLAALYPAIRAARLPPADTLAGR